MTDTDDENIKETRFNLSIFSGFILIGFVVIALFSSLSEDGTSGPASSSLWGVFNYFIFFNWYRFC